MIKFVGAPADILEVVTEASGHLSPKEQQAALITESHMPKYSTECSYQTDVDKVPTHKGRPILEVREEEQKVRDEDVTFFET